MTIRLKSKKDVQAPPLFQFSRKHIETLFSQDIIWRDFYKQNDFSDKYKWCVFPLLKKEGRFHTCVLHPMVEVDTGTKKINMKFENIHFSEFVFHCLFYKPQEHKQYILEQLSKR